MKQDMEKVIDAIKKEYVSAAQEFGDFASTHEGIAVIREEYLELEAEVFEKQSKYDFKKIQKEAIQLAAMALRFIVDTIPAEKE